MAKIGKCLWLEKSVVDELQRMAEKQGMSLSALVDHILKAGLDSTGELVDALDGMSLVELLKVLTDQGKKIREKRKK